MRLQQTSSLLQIHKVCQWSMYFTNTKLLQNCYFNLPPYDSCKLIDLEFLLRNFPYLRYPENLRNNPNESIFKLTKNSFQVSQWRPNKSWRQINIIRVMFIGSSSLTEVKTLILLVLSASGAKHWPIRRTENWTLKQSRRPRWIPVRSRLPTCKQVPMVC